ncbi:hypothetical protein M501DRAFT_935230 [Patellaria atrata CBS 101060]|uniref:Zn(2)-C6 fungal-type domain-containing protein n=1 Tax=Patellaria atrata CBS 101060 TaxID=1346257 RepID=A0A9P4S9V0_9PEZI|nr:hypothetical protein M501DRAFT_935230 [Patellaria atrata CBS 101060]
MVGHEQHLTPQHHHLSTSGLDTLAQGSQYALQQLQQGRHHPLANGKAFIKQRHHPYGNGPINVPPRHPQDPMSRDRSGRANSAAGPVRRRISRACDQCNQLRTKCDGKAPCAHCVEFGLTCEYVRERKKRGKASRKDIAQQQAAQAAAAAAASGTSGDTSQASPRSGHGFSSEEPNLSEGGNRQSTPSDIKRSLSRNDTAAPGLPPPPRSASMSSAQPMNGNGMYGGVNPMSRTMSLNNIDEITENGRHLQIQTHHEQVIDPSLTTPRMAPNGVHERGMSMVGMDQYTPVDEYQRPVMQHPANGEHHGMHNGHNVLPHPMLHTQNMQQFADSSYAMISPHTQQPPPSAFRLSTGESPMSGFLASSPVTGSPGGWLSLPSPGAALYAHAPQMSPAQSLRYPVLQPLLPHLVNIIPPQLACDLLELYFQSSSSAFMQPLSPYVLGFVFRKRSFLRQNRPRVCSPALLASMLWIGAQTSESPYLTSPPSARGKICQKLMELSVGLLKPLIHTPSSRDGSPHRGSTVINGVALGGFGVGIPTGPQEGESGSPGATGGLDDVATYMHLAIVFSASEYKAASLRWWNAAWSLARELKLGKELPPSPSTTTREGGQEEDADAEGDVDIDMGMNGGQQHGQNINGNGTNETSPQTPGVVTEEEREERRRIWWLLYTMDRHLALCYNKPLFLLDVECEGLLQPIDDTVWQSGEFYSGASAQSYSDTTSPYYRRRGPSFECTGHSIFGYFLPLMTILGEIVDLNHARNHPRFGLRFRSGSDCDEHAAEIAQQLEAYGRSLQEFETRWMANLTESAENIDNNHHEVGTPSVRSVSTSGTRINESRLQTKIIVAYGTHVMHTLHILLNGKWDPISLLDDNDLWISSQSFVNATAHAVSAAEAVSDILEYDPDLSCMPFFFGIYLLQGSFLLLLIADKLQGDASPNVVKACETIVRAHEVCVVTLNTEYQRNFRKVMRSALAQVRGRLLEDFGEQQARRREVLSLYRWTGDGTGLAL